MQWEFGIDGAKELRDREVNLALSAGGSGEIRAAPPMEGEVAQSKSA